MVESCSENDTLSQLATRCLVLTPFDARQLYEVDPIESRNRR